MWNILEWFMCFYIFHVLDNLIAHFIEAKPDIATENHWQNTI